MSKIMSRFTADAAELKKLIAEYPEYPICVLAGENANSGYYGWMVCDDVRFQIGKVLDCVQDVDDCRIYCDKDEFDEDLEEWLWDKMCDEMAEDKWDDAEPTEEAFQKRLAEEEAKYEPYWKDCIFIYVDN